MDLWSILLPVGYALLGYVASRMGIKIPLPGLPVQPVLPTSPVEPPVAPPVTPAPDNPKPILDALKEALPALLSATISEVLKRLGVVPSQDAGKVELMSFEAATGEGGMPVMATVINGFRFELVPRVSLAAESPAESPAA